MVHCGIAVGLPINPAGSLKWRSFVSAAGSALHSYRSRPIVAAFWFSVSVVVS